MSGFVCPGSSFRNCGDCENNSNYSGYWEKEESVGSVDYSVIGEGEY